MNENSWQSNVTFNCGFITWIGLNKKVHNRTLRKKNWTRLIILENEKAWDPQVIRLSREGRVTYPYTVLVQRKHFRVPKKKENFNDLRLDDDDKKMSNRSIYTKKKHALHCNLFYFYYFF